jgi:hypothetical protein
MNSSENKRVSVPQTMQARYQEIIALTDTLCQEKLNSEYRDLCRELTATLARKRPSPLNKGQIKTWACGVVYALGSVNFLFDKSQTPYMRSDELCAWFRVATSTGGNKAKQIREMFNMFPFDGKWTVPSIVEKDPMRWMISVDGFIVDARYLPRAIQEEVYQKGLIPYVPESSDTE